MTSQDLKSNIPVLKHEKFPKQDITITFGAESRVTNRLLISEVTDYLMENDGPDDKGLCHPIQSRVNIKVLKEALGKAYERGLSKEVTTVIFAEIIGLRDDPDSLEKLIRIKAESLVKSYLKENALSTSSAIDITDTKIQGYALSLFTTPNLRKSEKIVVNGKEREISFGSLFNRKFSSDPQAFAKEFLRLAGNLDLARSLRRYELPNLPKRTQDGEPYLKSNAHKLVVKACSVARSKYGNFPDLIRNLTKVDLHSPSYLNRGVQMVLSLKSVFNKRPDQVEAIGRFKALIIYFEEISESEKAVKVYLDPVSGLKPYHLKEVGSQTYTKNPELVEEVVLRKLGNLLITKYKLQPYLLRKNLAKKGEMQVGFDDYIDKKKFFVSTCQPLKNQRFNSISKLKEFIDNNEGNLIVEVERQLGQMPKHLRSAYRST